MANDDYEKIQARKRAAHPLIRQVIDRDCHVLEGGLAGVRHVIGKLRDGRRTFLELTKPERRRFLEQCLDVHRANRAEYEAVMWPRYDAPQLPEP